MHIKDTFKTQVQYDQGHLPFPTINMIKDIYLFSLADVQILLPQSVVDSRIAGLLINVTPKNKQCKHTMKQHTEQHILDTKVKLKDFTRHYDCVSAIIVWKYAMRKKL
jgi:hypothetical protein